MEENHKEKRLVRVIPVITRQDKRAFIDLPLRLYAQDEHYIHPLNKDVSDILNNRTLWFQHGELKAWLAFHGDQVVGRITAQRDELSSNQALGQFGFLEAIDDADVFSALLDTAAEWLHSKGATVLQGPFDPSINVKTGLLVDGFDTPPYMMMGHAPPFYEDRFKEYGLETDQELLAYFLDIRVQMPKIMGRLARSYRPKVRIRKPDWKKSDQEMEIMRQIFNAAWGNNWGFVPYTEAEFKELGDHLKLLIKPGWVHIVEYEDRPIAFIVLLPNMNELICGLRGKLFPTGFLRLLWRLKCRRVRTGRVPLMGVLPEFHGTPLAGAVSFLMIEQLLLYSAPLGLQFVELSWILKDNKGMRDIIEAISGSAYKRYKVYAKKIESSPLL